MADKAAWTIALDTVRWHMDNHVAGEPWMSPAVHAAQDALTAAGYPRLTCFERRAVVTVVLGQAQGADRDEIQRRLQKIRERLARNRNRAGR